MSRPPLDITDPRCPGNDPRYKDVGTRELPLAESLKDTIARFLPYWHEVIAPAIHSGKKTMIAAHGNSLRALVKYLDAVPDNEILSLNIPTGIPLIYELDEKDLKPLKHYYLGDAAEIEKAVKKVAGQEKQQSSLTHDTRRSFVIIIDAPSQQSVKGLRTAGHFRCSQLHSQCGRAHRTGGKKRTRQNHPLPHGPRRRAP